MKRTILITCLALCSSVYSFAQTPITSLDDIVIAFPNNNYYREFATVTVTNGNYDIVVVAKDKVTSAETVARYTLPVSYKGFISTVTWTGFNPSFSLINVPIKIRPAIKGLNHTATADVKNVGLMAGWGRTSIRYFSSGKTSSHKFAAGLFLAPGVATYDSSNTKGEIKAATSQIMLSGGIALTYTYNGITVGIVPLGLDIGLTNDAKKWVYNRQPWYGLGLGLDLKLFGLY